MPNENTFYRELAIDGVVDDTSRTVDVSFSSESAVRRYDWRTGEYYNEILGHEPGNVDLTRLETMGVALFNHNVDFVVGAVLDPVLDVNEHRCRAKIRFDTDDESEKIYQKVKSGTLKGISMMYQVGSLEVVKDGEKSTCGRHIGPCRIARKWTPYEVSPVSIPADPNVGVGRSADCNISIEELEEFRAWKRSAKEKEIVSAKNANLLRELEILEMEG